MVVSVYCGVDGVLLQWCGGYGGSGVVVVVCWRDDGGCSGVVVVSVCNSRQ